MLEVRITEAANGRSLFRAHLGHPLFGAALDRGNYRVELLCKIADFPKFPRAIHP